MALHGIDPGPVRDIDVLIDEVDAPAVFAGLDMPNRAAAAVNPIFRSRWFGCWTGAPLPVEVMAGFHVRAADGWEPVRPATRLPVMRSGTRLFVPDRCELHAMLLQFGRPGDLARAAAVAVTGSKPARTC